MDYYGLFPRFKYGRNLTDDELYYQLRQSDRNIIDSDSLISDAKVIKINSSFIELVDKYYYPKGMTTFISGVYLLGLSFSTFIFLLDFIGNSYLRYYDEMIYHAMVMIPAWIMATFLFIILKRECFCWTHYPIRFDRKNQIVHFFRLDGTTRSVFWKDVFFTMGLSHRKNFNKDYYISGHVLTDDGEIVVDSFCLPATSSDRNDLLKHWEFIRRYMEDGVESVVAEVDFCLPIDKERESFSFGLLYLLSGFNGAPIFLMPFFFVLSSIFSVPCFIAIRSSKIPVWPEEIEKLYQFEKDDPYIRDQTMNSPHPWRDIFIPPDKKDAEPKR